MLVLSSNPRTEQMWVNTQCTHHSFLKSFIQSGDVIIIRQQLKD